MTSKLSAIPLFRPIDADALEALGKVASVLGIPQGQDLIAEGTVADDCFVILDGRADVYLRGEKVAVIDAGELVGEVAVLMRRPRTATVRASTDLRVLRIDGEDLRRLMRDWPNFAAVVGRRLAQRE